MASQGELGETASIPPADQWNEATLLSELADHQAELVLDTLTRAEHTRTIEQENHRLSRELELSLDRIQEVHHRVRNHLQAVTGLLSAEEAAGAPEAAQRALRESIARLTSIAAIHDLLARDPRSGRVRLGELVESLSRHLLAQSGAEDRVRVEVQIEEATLHGKRLTAVVLVLTELIFNALEHGFPGGATGRVEVTLARAEAQLNLVVKDDGCGLPAGLETRSQQRLGLRLVQRLVERDLGGRLTVHSGPGRGACFEIAFPVSAEDGCERPTA